MFIHGAGCTSSSTCCTCGSSATTSKTPWAAPGSWSSTSSAGWWPPAPRPPRPQLDRAHHRRQRRHRRGPRRLILLFPRARVLTVFPVVIFLPVIDVPAWILLGIWFALQLFGGLLSLGAAAGRWCSLLRTRGRVRRRPAPVWACSLRLSAPPARGGSCYERRWSEPTPRPGLADYHTHSRFSDGEGSPDDVVGRALGLGLSELGICSTPGAGGPSTRPATARSTTAGWGIRGGRARGGRGRAGHPRTARRRDRLRPGSRCH